MPPQDYDAVCVGRKSAFASRRTVSTYIRQWWKREGEKGVGTFFEAGLKVAVFGGSGFLGHYVWRTRYVVLLHCRLYVHALSISTLYRFIRSLCSGFFYLMI
jgi:hypothetical protein